eukprot:6300857-Prymnesium_polylepis.2
MSLSLGGALRPCGPRGVSAIVSTRGRIAPVSRADSPAGDLGRAAPTTSSISAARASAPASTSSATRSAA